MGYLVKVRFLIFSLLRKLELSWEMTRPLSDPPIGIYNAGATCYLNTLIQCLYYVKGFREIILSIDLEGLLKQIGEENSKKYLQSLILFQKSTLFALQKVFYYLEHSRFPVELSMLIDSFHWTEDEITQQVGIPLIGMILSMMFMSCYYY